MGGAASGATFPSLASDPDYFQQGAITKMPTCLRIAGQAAAEELWREEYLGEWLARVQGAGMIEVIRNKAASRDLRQSTLLPAKGGGPEGDAGALQETAFGIIWACAHLLTAWDAGLLARDEPGDGRAQHGAIVLDLSLPVSGESVSGAIESVALARILSSPRLLPPAASGGVVIRNASLIGPLVFDHFDLNVPLSFHSVVLSGGEHGRGYLDGSRSSGALLVTRAAFRRSVVFSRTLFCGDVSIVNSRFDGGLEIVNSQLVDSCSEDLKLCWTGQGQTRPRSSCRPEGADPHLFKGEGGSSIRVSAPLRGQLRGELAGGGSSPTGLEVIRNHLGSFLLAGLTADGQLQISRNQIERDLTVRDLIPQQPDGFHFTVSDNEIQGGLFVEQQIRPGWQGRADLVSNAVRGDSQICIDDGWAGRLDLTGSTFDGALDLRLSDGVSLAAVKEDGYDLAPSCGAYSGRVSHPDRWEGRYCDAVGDPGTLEAPQAVVDLTAANVGVLRWNLPIRCEYRWLGAGLSYQLWQGPAGPNSKIAFKAWRTTLASLQPASLLEMADYLAERGDFVGSRQLTLEAKRINYADSCLPQALLTACLYDIFFKRQNLLAFFWYPVWAQVANWFDREQDACFVCAPKLGAYWDATVNQTSRAILLLLLAPGGYGAAPERALALAVVAWGMFLVASALYAQRQRRNLAAICLDLCCSPRWQGKLSDESRAYLASLASGTGELSLPVAPYQGLRAVIADLRGRSGLDASDQDHLSGLEHRLERLGTSGVPGFSQRSEDYGPKPFGIVRYSIDTAVPLISLHAYDQFFPTEPWMRRLSFLQHVLGWWWFTIFLASFAIL